MLSQTKQPERCPSCNRLLTKGRSNPQNKSYWKLCVEPLAEFLSEQGYTKDDVHELLKAECNYEVKFLKDKDGRITEKKIPQTTTKMTTAQFMDFMERIRVYASGLGKYLYEPNEPPLEDRE